MKRILILLMITCLLPACAPGPGGGPPGRGEGGGPSLEQRVDRRVSLLASRLHLSQEQAAQLRPIIEADMRQRQALREQYQDLPLHERTKKLSPRLDALTERTEAQLAQVLGPEGMRSYHELMSQLEDGRMPRRPPRYY
ncbi:hypothetical protein Deba_3056 [Desulfarculus baarsii DSM 2075]|uniref:Lipoprotein n=1 Tax=Desulfarculus baarsii (strain ATCC 33931 / DSM 2075 / LMG 7858 / VKM B-1802 / 2st14) TaxID=644282 RepID=E1QLH4_DESB2|nr:hypothetical protein [Desulfarculus baarsii]ADK86409.1 hypothetical protein Deba_3056 [Desulfarculus baarsii DSM 2075]